MNRSTTTLLAAMLLTFTVPVSACTIGEWITSSVFRGDVNGDGKISDEDSRLLLEIIAHEAEAGVSHRQLDTDGDGEITLADVARIIASASEREPEAPAESRPEGESREARPEERDDPRPDGSGSDSGDESEGAPRSGDLNGDGTVDMTDAKLLADVILNAQPSPAPRGALDVNRDGSLDLRDVEELLAKANRDRGATDELPSAPQPEPVRRGDVNDDGQVDMADVIVLLHAFAGQGRITAPREAADVNGDGEVNMADLSSFTARML